MPIEGRGRFYGRTRAASEWILARAYRGGWPARVTRRLGLQRRVRVVYEHVVVPQWPRVHPTLRIAFASDLHAGPTTDPSLHDEALARVRELDADVVLLGGDYVFLDARHFPPLADRLAPLIAPLGRFAVMGNHDLWANDAAIASGLDRAGFRVLCNESVALGEPFADVSICGLDDPWTGARNVTAAFAGARAVRVLLMHSPAGVLLTKDERFAVALCGHTHGGHIALPGGVPIVAMGPNGRRHPHGRHELPQGTLIVSRGVGATESPLRMFADPDVLCVELTPPTSGDAARRRAGSARDA